ncbi:CheR family methyltransferase [Desertivirga arenae]|uniref:CheR family methyltransferase n=1 Tax=Desertivirga arenae TaxID=2810309 RepID=UPI001A9593BE|nr:protein-glutamate O-methyltransferase CheR [Pedobacter sp. SYSU D00823]
MAITGTRTAMVMSVHEFHRLSSFIYTHYGIKLPMTKKTMLEGRLHKRLVALKLPGYKAYCDYLFSAEGKLSELIQMVDLVTTNKTDFFREAIHFDYLSRHVLPSAAQNDPGKLFSIWSAGCSTGEEPYTLAITLSEFAELNRGFNFSIFATDISTRVLGAAVKAVYSEEKVQPIPLVLKRKYLLKSKDVKNKTVRIAPQLRSKVNFERINFIDDDFSTIQVFNVVFCRNVLIYFDRETQEKVIRKLCSKIEEGGYLFLGHSESISGMDLPLIQVHPTIFKKI